MLTIGAIIDEIDHLKPIADIAGKVMRLLDDPDSGMADLYDIIRYEPALTADVLKLANSAYFGLPGKVADVKQAVVYLGMTQVVDLVLVVSCSQALRGSHDGYGLARGDLWKCAVAGAIMANDLTEIRGRTRSSLTFTGALLRDIGKVVIDQHVKSVAERILERVHTQNIDFMTAEQQVLGVDHAQVGAMVAEKWHLPNALPCIIRYHHRPLEADGCFEASAFVHLADFLCRKMGIGIGIDDGGYVEDERVIQALGLDATQVQAVMDGFQEKMARVAVLFSAG